MSSSRRITFRFENGHAFDVRCEVYEFTPDVTNEPRTATPSRGAAAPFVGLAAGLVCLAGSL